MAILDRLVPGSPTGTVVTDVWQTELWRFTRNAANDWTADLWVDDPTMSGPPLFSYNNGHTDAEMWSFRLWAGGVAGKGADGEIYYVDNVKVGTTPNGGEYFCSDFEHNYFGWEFDGFPVPSIVDDPLGTGGPSTKCGPLNKYQVLGTNGLQGGFTFPPVFVGGIDGLLTDTIPLSDIDGEIVLDWVEHGDSYYVLLLKDSSAWFGDTFPPPDGLDANAPLRVLRFPKDNTAPTSYDCGADLSMCWGFDDTFGSTPGCFGPQVPGVDCTPGRTGYWWPENFWFTNWKKLIANARIASDGENLWVGAIAYETEEYPFQTADDSDSTAASCGTVSIPSTSSQFIDISTLTAGFTTFQDAEPSAGDLDAPIQGCGTLTTRNDYQRWAKFGRGPFGTAPREPPESDGGDHYSCFYQVPKLVMFVSDGASDFTRIGDTPAIYAYAFSEGSGGDGIDLQADSMIGDLALCASPAEPGVCHAVWGEGGAYGARLRPGSNPNSPDDVFEVWDTEQNTIGFRIAYSRWDGAGNTLDTDLESTSQDRTDWFYGSAPGTDLGVPPDSAYAEILELRNQHGTPALFMALLSFERFASAPHGPTAYAARGSIDLSYYDLSGGTLALLETLDAASFAPTLPEVQLVDPSITDAPDRIARPQVSPSFLSSPKFSVSDLWYGSYVVGAAWTNGEFGIYPAQIGMGMYQITEDGSAPFDFLIGDRTNSIAPTAAHPEIGPPVGPIVLGDISLWMIQQTDVPTARYITWRLDLADCDEWWDSFDTPSFFGTPKILRWREGHGTPKLIDLFGIPADGLIWPANYLDPIHHIDHFGLGEAQIFTLECVIVTGAPVFRNRFKAQSGIEIAPAAGAGNPVFDTTFGFKAADAPAAAPAAGGGEGVFGGGAYFNIGGLEA
jgi:hypothetical protein